MKELIGMIEGSYEEYEPIRNISFEKQFNEAIEVLIVVAFQIELHKIEKFRTEYC